MAFPRIGGQGIPLNMNNALGSLQPGVGGSVFSSPAQGSNAITMPAGNCFYIPAGTFMITTGSYTCLQYLDPVLNEWKALGASADSLPYVIDSDGGNYRLANLTGTPVGALITNSGASYTNGIGTAVTGLTITPSAGGSVWIPVVGGAINSTVTITTAGTNYTFPPLLVISAPPAGGIQATATCTVSAGAINAVTVTNQGAGYTTAPIITVVNDYRDTTGSGAVLTVNATLVNSGGLTAMYPSAAQTVAGHGTVLTAVPTFTFSPASTTAATAIMNFVLTGFTVAAGGAAYGNAQPFVLLSMGGIVAGSRASNTAGPIADTGVIFPRQGAIFGTSTAGGAIQTSGSVITDAGFGFQAVPFLGVLPAGNSLPTTIAQATATVGGIVDTSYVQPI